MNFSITGPITEQKYRITMEDGSQWEIPVLLIALNRAEYYAKVDEVELNESLNKDTVPLFESCEDEIEDWAKGNMDWEDIRHAAKCVKQSSTDFQEGWVNGDAEIV